MGNDSILDYGVDFGAVFKEIKHNPPKGIFLLMVGIAFYAVFIVAIVILTPVTVVYLVFKGVTKVILAPFRGAAMLKKVIKKKKGK